MYKVWYAYFNKNNIKIRKRYFEFSIKEIEKIQKKVEKKAIENGVLLVSCNVYGPLRYRKVKNKELSPFF